MEITCGDIAEGHRLLEEADYVVEAAVIQVILIHDGGRCHNAHHFPACKRLGVLRELHLLTDGYLLPRVKKPLDVIARSVIRDAAHGVIALVCQSQVQEGRYLPCIVIEHLVEVADTEKEHHVGVLLFHFAVLLHQRCLSHYSLLIQVVTIRVKVKEQARDSAFCTAQAQ